jgi:hypothetical protein
MMPMSPVLKDFLDDMEVVSGSRGMHLAVLDGKLVAVDDRPGVDPVPVEWDDTLKRYLVADD